MRAGNLIRITRASIGVPMGSLALIVEDKYTSESGVGYWAVMFVGGKLNGRTRRYLTQDMRRVN